MALLQKDAISSPLMSFVQHQTLSLMRGVQIANEHKISSLFILLTAAERVAKRHNDASHEALFNAIAEISSATIDHHQKRIADTHYYIEQLLYRKTTNTISENLQVNHGCYKTNTI